MEPSLTLDNMINNPDILLSAVNETFANDMTQQYYTPQTPSTYIPQPVQQMPQKQQSKTQVIEVFLKEVNELRSRVKNWRSISTASAASNVGDTTHPDTNKAWHYDQWPRDYSKRRSWKSNEENQNDQEEVLEITRQSTNSPFQGYHFPRKNITKLAKQYTLVNATE